MLRSLLFRTWLVTLVASLLLIALVYFAGQLVWEPLGGGLPFWITAAVIMTGWAGYNALNYWRRRHRDKALIAGVASGGDPSSAEVRLLRERLEQCLKRIKETASAEGSRHLSELPWYILIGPPGAGKTTALAKSGLRFIGLGGRDIEAVGGVGGTRNCDWFFTEQAVLIDTAGRLTTQNNDQPGDRATWLGFLDLLKTHRPRQPVNGVIVATSLPDLAALPEAARRQQAQAIRERLSELRNRLGIELPVYVLFTKLDRVNGFIEFFGELQRDERRQVWGFTLPPPATRKDDPELLVQAARQETQTLFACLAGRMTGRIYQVPDAARRGLIFNFPHQMAALRPTIDELLEEVFGPSRYDRSALLRGVYFTSGVQEGAPIDRVMAALSRTFGLTASVPRARGASGQSYFLSDLLDNVIFPEAGLVGIDPVVERRLRAIRVGAYVAVGALSVVLLSLWTISLFVNLGLIKNTASQIPAYLQTVNPLLGQTAPPDPRPVLPALARLRAFSGLDSLSASTFAGFGLYQGETIRDGGKLAYQHGLNAMLLPRLTARLAALVAQSSNDAEAQYRYLKALLMVSGSDGARLDRGFIKSLFADIWRDDGFLPEDAAGLANHLAALVDGPMNAIPINLNLIEAARNNISQNAPPDRRGYAAIKSGEDAKTLKAWILLDHAGPSADQALALRSNRPLASISVSGFFTHEGFEHALLTGIAHASDIVANDSWVLGDRARPMPADKLTQNILKLYEDEFVKTWDDLFNDLAIKKVSNVDETVQVLDVLGSPSSPLTTLIPDIVKETQLTRRSQEMAVASVVTPGAAASIQRREDQAASVATAMGDNFHPGLAVTQHYQNLARYAGTGNGSSQLDTLVRSLGQAGEELRRLSVPGQDTSLSSVLASASSLRRLKDQAASMPLPLSTLIGSIGDTASGMAAVGARDQVKGDWNGSILPYCKAIVDGRYPFQRDDTGPGVPLEDFASLLGPNGKIDAYFNQNLKSLVDTSGATWRWKSGGGVNVGLNQDVLMQMQHASKIRTAFFQGGTGQLGFTLFITPRELDQGMRSAELTIDGQTVSYSFGPQQPATIHWPGQSGPSQIRLALISQDGGATSAIGASGPWAWYRFVDQAQVENNAAGNGIKLTFSVNGHRVAYDVVGSSVFTPMTTQSLESFHCPSL